MMEIPHKEVYVPVYPLSIDWFRSDVDDSAETDVEKRKTVATGHQAGNLTEEIPL